MTELVVIIGENWIGEVVKGVFRGFSLKFKNNSHCKNLLCTMRVIVNW